MTMMEYSELKEGNIRDPQNFIALDFSPGFNSPSIIDHGEIFDPHHPEIVKALYARVLAPYLPSSN
jgi:hypothetical protein